MTCELTDLPPADEIDIPAMRARYYAERDKRLNSSLGDQYLQDGPGDLHDFYNKDPYMAVQPRDPVVEELDVAVLGAGFGGVMASYHLVQQGVTNIRNIDHSGDFGGVWYWNRYPGIQCDNESYCYLPLLEETGFMPSRRFAPGPEIMGYIRLIAEKFGFADKALFHTLITSLKWDDSIQRWRIATDRGDEIRARFVVMGCGVLNMPKLPGIPGIATFKGKMFHTSRWEYDYTGGSCANPVLDKLKDKRVAIVGTGATAIQAVPHLAEYAKHLYVVQRTPSCVDTRPNPLTDPDWIKSLEPGWQQERIANFQRHAMEVPKPGEPDLVCDFWTEINRSLFAELEAEGWPQETPEQFMARREVIDYRVMERFRRRVDTLINDPDLAERLKPYYRFLCKRPLSSDTYYPAFEKPSVTLIDTSETQGLERITEKGFMQNGVEYEVDCIIFASGFEVSSSLERRWGIDAIEGRGGVSLYDHWREGPKTMHGTMTHGFPNMFYIGYIQGGLNGSVTEQFGRQGEHSAWVIAETLRRGAKVAETTEEGMNAYCNHFAEIEVDTSAFQAECTPSYFNNEGQKKAPWALFRAYGHGWDAWLKLLADWREAGKFEGMKLES
ncbi:NAD(P)/FAD-dependent oxidoreductase [Novosphingobium sp. TH158]|uniref:flavin-containing monooxygenase n=1 Tax=Novosphingobium sp. TH158 TaxID=2067455 RepID=UPI000C7C10B6|nr:NAD(P)/FAD-dependent oxidoreductase [Novosphingobium sp. TH158]PLK25648.1 monooxygenase [Novosphingobium sp. TH158]